MKNIIIWFIVFIGFIITMAILMDNDIMINVSKTYDTNVFDLYEKKYLKDIIDKNVEVENQLLDTSSLGERKVSFVYKKDNYIYNYNIIYNVVDKTPPVIMGSASKTIKKGTKVDLVNSMLCGDNYDKRPNCYIKGEYDVNKVGIYNLVYVAEDTSGNVTERDYKLTVKSSISSSESTSTTKSIKLDDIISKHKNDNTMIGIDVSSWQEDISWQKVKNAGVEFAMIRIGYGHNKDNELVFDKKFKNNLKNAKAAGIKVGLYFYTYATKESQAIEQAKWIVEALNGEKLDLPIAFDWESWTKFNSYNISFNDLNSVAEAFIKEIEKHGYEGMIYGSCSYLERIWNLPEYKTWVAHYATKTDYSKEYMMWQLTSSGKVSGINGYVDLDILYKK